MKIYTPIERSRLVIKLFNLKGSLFSYLRTVMEKRHKKVNLDPNQTKMLDTKT